MIDDYVPGSIAASMREAGIEPAAMEPEPSLDRATFDGVVFPEPVAIRTIRSMEDYDAMMGEGSNPYMRGAAEDALARAAQGPLIYELPAPPSAAEETTMTNWEDEFTNVGADPKNIARATNILQALRANGVSQKRIDERGKGLLETLMQGKAPKESRTREERQRKNSAMPEQQTLPDSVAVMRAERDQLSREIDEFDEFKSAMDAKRERYSLLCRMLAAGEEA